MDRMFSPLSLDSRPSTSAAPRSPALALDDIRFDIADGCVIDAGKQRGGTHHPPPRRLAPTTLFSCDWCAVHHLAAGAIPHYVEMQRQSHTLLVFDSGSHSDGKRLIDGVRMGSAGPLDRGVDIVPAHAHLAAWSGTTANIGVSLIFLDSDALANVIGKQAMVNDLHPDINLRNDLLIPLLARIRRWPIEQQLEIDSIQRETILMLVTQEIVRHQHSRQNTRLAPHAGLSPRAQKLLKEFVAANYDTQIQLQTLADLVDMSRFHFSRAFKASFGLPPHKYLLNERMQVATAKLRQTQDSITEIAMQVGFSSSGELARLFRQRMGCTPSEFRTTQRLSAAATRIQKEQR
ncbi:helix-turn-helix transcriptional regulator [Pseudomonas aeruginosa]|nr:helix-turn-helix transcriptional regulator [Pseudomonas aeruginosa]